LGISDRESDVNDKIENERWNREILETRERRTERRLGVSATRGGCDFDELSAAIFLRHGRARLQWVASVFGPMVRNRSGFDSLSVRFWFDFVPLGDVGLEAVTGAVRIRFDFVPVLVRFWFTDF
jgi:hypothetical protein